MKPRHQVSRAAIELIERFEGYRRKAAQLPDGRWTIGYGHTLTARQGAEVSEEDAEALLLYDLIAVAHVVNESTYAPLSQNQFDALCAFAFNVGLDNFRRSAVLKRVNEGAFIQAAFDMERWRKADFEGERIVVDGLVRRRAAEKTLFLTPPGAAYAPVPSSLLKPVLDLDGLDAAPRQAPTPVVASLEGEQVLAHREGEPVAEPEPAPQDEPNPLRAAAEEVTARLQTIFPETGEVEAQPPDAEVEQDQAEEPAESVVEFTAEPVLDDLVGDEAPAPAPEPVVEELAGHPAEGVAEDLVGDFGPAEDEAPPQTEQPETGDTVAEPAEPEAEAAPERVVIDDTAPYEFIPAQVRSLEEPKDSLLGLVFLAVLGLAFFGGGIFWALNARPGVAAGPLTPLTVGWLAGVAGVGFFVVAVFLLLQRLGRAAERRRSDNPRI